MFLNPLCGWSQENIDEIARQHLEKIFSASIVLTDSDVITLGFVDFDPQQWLPIPMSADEEEGDALLTRARLRTFSLPLTSERSVAQFDNAHILLDARVSFFELNEAVHLDEFDEKTDDQLLEQVFDVYFGGGWQISLSDRWTFSSGAGLHLMRYRNRYQYNDALFAQQREALDRVVLNTDATAIVAEPYVRMQYDYRYGQYPLQFRTAVNYAYGRTINTDQDSIDAYPESWRVSNSLVAGRALPALLGYASHLKLFAKRVDLGAEAKESLSTPYYYELGAGWLWYVKNEEFWLDNIGVGVSMNFNSDLSGGTVVFLFNENY